MIGAGACNSRGARKPCLSVAPGVAVISDWWICERALALCVSTAAGGCRRRNRSFSDSCEPEAGQRLYKGPVVRGKITKSPAKSQLGKDNEKRFQDVRCWVTEI